MIFVSRAPASGFADFEITNKLRIETLILNFEQGEAQSLQISAGQLKKVHFAGVSPFFFFFV